jgi:hypothetical protein
MDVRALVLLALSLAALTARAEVSLEDCKSCMAGDHMNRYVLELTERDWLPTKEDKEGFGARLALRSPHAGARAAGPMSLIVRAPRRRDEEEAVPRAVQRRGDRQRRGQLCAQG